MSTPATEYSGAYAAHIEAANSLQRSHVRLIGTNDKINYLAAALKAAKEDKVRLLREVERKRKAAGDATVAFYATVAKSTRYEPTTKKIHCRHPSITPRARPRRRSLRHPPTGLWPAMPPTTTLYQTANPTRPSLAHSGLCATPAPC
jgi:hypothetical protein